MYLNIIRSIFVIFYASLPFFIHSFRLSIFDGRHCFCAALPACYIVGCAATPFLIFEYIPVFVFDLDVVIGFCTVFGNIVCFGATMVQDVLFPLAGDTSVNDGGLSFLLNMCLDLLALLHIC